MKLFYALYIMAFKAFFKDPSAIVSEPSKTKTQSEDEIYTGTGNTGGIGPIALICDIFNI